MFIKLQHGANRHVQPRAEAGGSSWLACVCAWVCVLGFSESFCPVSYAAERLVQQPELDLNLSAASLVHRLIVMFCLSYCGLQKNERGSCKREEGLQWNVVWVEAGRGDGSADLQRWQTGQSVAGLVLLDVKMIEVASWPKSNKNQLLIFYCLLISWTDLLDSTSSRPLLFFVSFSAVWKTISRPLNPSWVV